MRRTLVFLSLLLLAPLAGAASAETPSVPAPRNDLTQMPIGLYTLDPKHASLVWRIKHLGISYLIGRFNSLEGQLALDTRNPENSRLKVEIYAASVSTHVGELDAQLVKAPFFDAQKYPKISFVSKKITVTGPQSGTIEGEVTMLGIIRPVTLEAKLVGAGMNPFAKAQTVGFTATGTIKRSEFGLRAYPDAVGDEVELQIDAEFNLNLSNGAAAGAPEKN